LSSNVNECKLLVCGEAAMQARVSAAQSDGLLTRVREVGRCTLKR